MFYVGLYVLVFKNRMNVLVCIVDIVIDVVGYFGMKNDNFKDGEMRLMVGLVLMLVIMICGVQVCDM